MKLITKFVLRQDQMHVHLDSWKTTIRMEINNMKVIFYLSEDFLRALVPTWDLPNQCSSAPVLFPVFFLLHFL